MQDQSLQTRKIVYERYKGKCAFCGIDLTIEQHHIVAKNEAPHLVDDPDNLILLCANHHTLTQKIKPNSEPTISFKDIAALEQSKYRNVKKTGFYFEIPQRFQVNLGGNICSNCPYVLVVNKKPLIEVWPQKPTYYSNGLRIYLSMRFFDESNNFIGGMFANSWSSVSGEEFNFEFRDSSIRVSHKQKPITVEFGVKDERINIKGEFYSDGIKILANENELILPGYNRFIGNSIANCEVAFNISGDKKQASLGICGKLV